MIRRYLSLCLLVLLYLSCKADRGTPSVDYEIEKWAYIFQPSVLTEEERIEELSWFKNASRELSGVTIRSTAENIETHYWESRFLSKAFEEITGIKVDQVIQGEGDVVLDLMDQVENGQTYYDIYINDADLVGTHLRMNSVVNLSSYMRGEGGHYTNPYLDLDDFLNLEMGQDYEGEQLQLPDQQFANLYWFRYDWFSRDDIKELFHEQYGYELGVPVNWAAYADIAEFFTNNPVDGKKVYGHLDYGLPSHSLGWRFTDAWLSMAGMGDKGLPNGTPVDEWGIRVEDKIPRGASVSRGGALNSPASIYALETYIDWIKNYAPEECLEWDGVYAGPQSSRGDIAQQIFQYTYWLSDIRYHSPDSPVCDKDGLPKWRVAPSPHGKYWEKGMKVGYQDCGSWTIPRNVTDKQRAAAWLWAQFCVSKTVSLKKFTVGNTFVRKSTVFSPYLTENIAQYGGLIEFYRSGERKKWTDSGLNVPYYAEMSALWWNNIALAIEGQVSPAETMDTLAKQIDYLMAGLSLERYSPLLNEKADPQVWFDKPGAPKKPVADDAPLTIDYDELLALWKEE